jgi:hypothetical protein
MSKGTFRKTLTVGVLLATEAGAIGIPSIEVEASGSWDYDPGCRYTANGDGWPPSLDFEIESIGNQKSIIEAVRSAVVAAGIICTETDEAIIEAARDAVDAVLAEEDVREFASNNSDY